MDNREDYINFSNQTRNPIEVVDKEEPDFLGKEDLPELYDREDREQVDFDLSDSTADKSAQSRKSLLCFFNVDNHFFYSVVYDLMYLKLKGGEHFIEIKNARETLGDELFFKLKEIENFCMLDHSVFGFFDRCQKMNEILSGYGYFLRFYERRINFRYQIRKKLKEKNEIRKELFSCIVPNFIGHEILRNHLNSKERQEYVPIDIVYEPTLNEKNPIVCFFASDVSHALNSKIEKMKNGKRELQFKKAQQCHYCINYFVKSFEKMQKHLSCCSGKAGFTFSFDNGKVIDYQDHFSSLRDVPFSLYYDFETTAGNTVFFDAKMYVVSYRMIIAFHQDLKIPRLVVYRGYDQDQQELQSLTNFQVSEYDFLDDRENFNKLTLKQLQDASSSVFNREKLLPLQRCLVLN